ncbi:MAG TPA: hypothetical protein VKL22_03605 [Actinomycetota bacterium]|nr:hypothetical protein [Actinomycetota bacterium]
MTEPAAVNFGVVKDLPGSRFPLSHDWSSAVAVCGTCPVFLKVTDWPTWTVVWLGLKWKLDPSSAASTVGPGAWAGADFAITLLGRDRKATVTYIPSNSLRYIEPPRSDGQAAEYPGQVRDSTRRPPRLLGARRLNRF